MTELMLKAAHRYRERRLNKERRNNTIKKLTSPGHRTSITN